MKVVLLANTPNPETLVSMAARLCYSQSNIEEVLKAVSETSQSNYIKFIKGLGHDSIFEHISFTFGIEDVSRVLEQQLTRHRIASYSIQSGRYVHRDPTINLPECIANTPEVLKIFKELEIEAISGYQKISKILLEKYLKEGMTDREAEKKAIEDARYILPNGLNTKIICTMNARSLFNLFELRCCRRAQHEINELAWEMLKLVREVAPNIFNDCGPACLRNGCKEGNLSCKQPYEKESN